MTIRCYTLQRGSIDKAGKWPCWNLLDPTGKIVGQATDREGIGDLIAAKQLAALLAYNCALAGLLIAEHARYQVAEDLFNDPEGVTEE